MGCIVGVGGLRVPPAPFISEVFKNMADEDGGWASPTFGATHGRAWKAGESIEPVTPLGAVLTFQTRHTWDTWLSLLAWGRMCSVTRLIHTVLPQRSQRGKNCLATEHWPLVVIVLESPFIPLGPGSPISPGIPCGNKHTFLPPSYWLCESVKMMISGSYNWRVMTCHPALCFPKELSAVLEALSSGLSSTVASNRKGIVNIWKWLMGLKNWILI